MDKRTAEKAERLASQQTPPYLRVACTCQTRRAARADPYCDICDGQGHFWTLEPGLAITRYSDRELIVLLQSHGTRST